MTLSVRRVAPLLSVRTGAATVEFYKQAFGVEERFRIDDGEGAVVATLGVGDLEFWVADESPQNANFSPETVGGSTVRLILYADDPGAGLDRAVEAGARIVRVQDQPHGRTADRLGAEVSVLRRLVRHPELEVANPERRDHSPFTIVDPEPLLYSESLLVEFDGGGPGANR